jgi:hypothetical protein
MHGVPNGAQTEDDAAGEYGVVCEWERHQAFVMPQEETAQRARSTRLSGIEGSPYLASLFLALRASRGSGRD